MNNYDVGDGGYIFPEPLMFDPITSQYYRTSVKLIDNNSMLPRPGEELYSHIAKTHPGTSKLGWVVVTNAIRGNLTYIRFPKKAKRKLNRSTRIHKKSHARPYIMVFDSKDYLETMKSSIKHVNDVRRRFNEILF